MTMRLWDLVVIILYFLGMAAFGVYFSKKNKSTEDYFMGNRSFPAWAVGISMVGTAISSISFIAIPGDSFKTTWIRSATLWYLPIATLVTTILFVPFYRRTKTTSAYEFLEGRWGSATRIYASSMFYPAQLLRMSTILYLLAQLMHALLGWPMMLCIALSGIVVSFYTITGGIEAVVWTDVVQTAIFVIGGLSILGFIIQQVPGGLGEIIRTGLADHKLTLGEMLKDGSIAPPRWDLSFSKKTISVIFLMTLSNGIVYMCSDQNVVQRYCTAKNVKDAKKALWISCFTSIPIWAYFYFLGTAIYVFFKYFPTEKAMNILHGTNGAKAEEIVPYLVMNYMPTGLAGLVVAACLAATMSTLSSNINSVSTVFINDLYRRYLKPGRDDKHYLRIAHLTALIAALLMMGGAALLVVIPINTLQDAIFQTVAFLGNGITVIFILGLFTKIGHAWMLIPGIVVIYIYKIWILIGNANILPPAFRIPIDNYYVGITGEILGLIVVLLLALIFPKKQKDLSGHTLWG